MHVRTKIHRIVYFPIIRSEFSLTISSSAYYGSALYCAIYSRKSGHKHDLLLQVRPFRQRAKQTIAFTLRKNKSQNLTDDYDRAIWLLHHLRLFYQNLVENSAAQNRLILWNAS